MPVNFYGSSQSDPRYANFQGSQTYAPKSVPQVKAPAPPIRVTPKTTGSVLGTSTSRIPSGGTAPAGNAVLRNDINQQVDTGNQQIDSDYDNYINELNAQQGEVSAQGNLATEKLQGQAASARTQYGRERDTAVQGIESQEKTTQTQSASALQQARDLYRQIQQQNVAQLSGAGLSSSSVAEALAERLGVETARRIAGVTGSRDEVLQNLNKEKINLNTYYQTRLSELEDRVGLGIKEIQSQLLSSVDQINRAKQVAASDRANKRAQLMSQAQTQIANLQAQAQNFQQALDQWKAQNEAKLSSTSSEIDKWLGQNSRFQSAVSNVGMNGLLVPPQLAQYGQSLGYDIQPGTRIVRQGTIRPEEEEAGGGPF